jgi:hypothetical protein
MALDATTKEIREWLYVRGYDVPEYGRIAAEFHDIWLASTEGYIPEGVDPVVYVNAVRKYQISRGAVMERMMYLSPYHFRGYNMKDEESTEVPSEHDLTLNAEISDPSFDAHEAEGHQMNEAFDKFEENLTQESAKRTVTGMAYVTQQMNLMYCSLAVTTLFEAINVLNSAFGTDGGAFEDSHARVQEAQRLLAGANKFLTELASTFKAVPVEFDLNKAYGDIARGLRLESLFGLLTPNMKIDLISPEEFLKRTVSPDSGIDRLAQAIKDTPEQSAKEWQDPMHIKRHPHRGKSVVHVTAGTVGYIEAVGIDKDADTMYLIHWYDNDITHEWCFPDEAEITSP